MPAGLHGPTMDSTLYYLYTIVLLQPYSRTAVQPYSRSRILLEYSVGDPAVSRHALSHITVIHEIHIDLSQKNLLADFCQQIFYMSKSFCVDLDKKKFQSMTHDKFRGWELKLGLEICSVTQP
jgi:hypothetical protein